ncbi:TetR/AcrR family transcriptional regulator [Saccharomonospora sp. NPDC046836]|uniref:TetR/AcrR family transcriptional regulator n=1 Tax=Saccharomonospora sp. NPDC046836 TaxID=3156921 RepID=UPI0033DF2FAA
MAPKTRDLLISAAADLLDQGGLEAVTLREVSHRAGVSHNAPYKHFADKEALLAAVAAKEMTRLGSTFAALEADHSAPEDMLRSAMREYVVWALSYPARFKLVFGTWTTGTEELAMAAESSRTILIGLVGTAQRAGVLPSGDVERTAALLQAVVHGAVDLALSGHLAIGGKGHASPEDLVDDLLRHLRISATAATHRKS